MNGERVDPLDRIPYRLTELWKHQEGDEESIYVMDGIEGHIYQLNLTAGQLWTLMDGQRTLGTVIADCLDTFEVDDHDEAKTLLLQCVDDLDGRGLIAFQEE